MQEDITDVPVDAIVNPANSHLGNEGGAAKAIQEAAGIDFIEECQDYIEENKELKTGQAMSTHSGDMHCKYVFHTVGPICDKNQESYSKQSK
mmetsp:Transcript_205/g.198  ORF Transcript_205/g.198 Transcript_205/m.198 type:complete len:92 (+) Transcript_205:276-551(+)